ncbi:hypothetical protein MJO28_007867 [Puccinia striiformis f. sp. tritici]|uniref:Kinase n=3 Tax=Puccinia striiformis TaxID=27350 RepID=A0A0L0VA22_9BASI|nr:hypothetical protein Pst134EB_033495 [Puccinia striiformis f. sp. tritici]KNE96137.1 hypothetical protein PSTG_10557 [Puccinia striiformis f. sp. tritici PST-78]POW11252.1 hypothetical protein PSTT_05388 [Puccinia striiformis]KAI7952183.1 hypothetical protein MJO28_007867 [Puccinia striiformis f. sp. tritici]KAI7956414.1 hypothetical protein MJO29_007813 [Puccinia striiformis f. sp. tritici]
MKVAQAGGHPDLVSIDSAKPHQLIKQTTKNELEFYRSIVNQLEYKRLSTDLKPWSDWRPNFYGSLDDQTDNEASIVLENLTYQRPTPKTELFSHPNVIDIKLGQRLYDDHATPEKQERMNKAALETTSAQWGVRLTGAQIWDHSKGIYLNIPKSFGKSVKPDGSDLQNSFNKLFPISDSNQHQEELAYSTGSLSSEILKNIIDQSIIPQIIKIQTYLSSFKWRIYGASLLIVFEADQDVLLSATSHSDQQIFQDLASVKVIDFAHVQLADSPDPGLLKGIQTTLDLFHQLSLQLSLQLASVQLDTQSSS